MKLYKLLLLLIMVFSITTSCDNELLGPTRDIEEEVVDPNPDPDPVDPIPEPSSIDISETFGNDVQRSFLGRVIDVNENPISTVDIGIGNSSTSTDSNGIFIINDATIKENFGYITASKAGYVQGSRSVVPTTGINKVTIMLLDETVVGSTSSGAQPTINLPNGASVTLHGNYIKEDGSAYQGNVDIIMHHLDPTDPNMEAQMPGMLFAANANNEAQVLKSFGMLAVELRGTGGEKLNLAENTTAEIEVPVPAELMADAPSTIPLWYFDEETGYWKEEGEAQLFGNTYIGSVTHFSFWNCDIPIDFVKLCIEVVDQDNNPLANHNVSLTSLNYGSTNDTTNSLGQVCGFIPLGGNFTINISGYGTCNEQIIHSETIGTISSDSSITIIVPYSPNLISETVKGVFKNCDGDVVSNGYVLVTNDGEQFIDQVIDGTFEISFLRCSQENTFTIQAYDYDTFQSTGELNYGFTTPLTNLGSLSACDAVTEFITYQIGDNPPITYFSNFSVSSLDYDYDPFSLFVQCYASPNYLVNFYMPSQNTGSFPYQTNDVDIKLRDVNNPDLLHIDYNHTIHVNVTNVGYGQYVDINFSGTFGNNQEQITGVIHVLWD
jgi:hypothetical protein